MRLFRQKVNWRYAAGEFVLVILGILVALGIDACAERARDENRAAAYLRELVVELRGDSAYFERRRLELERIVMSASTVLEALQRGSAGSPDLASQLLNSLSGDAIPVEPVVWEELRATGNIRLISDGPIRSLIVAHYLDRAGRLRVLDENFTPAVRELRALAWDLLPIQSFMGFFQTGDPDLPSDLVLESLRTREDAEFLLKRTILTARVARGYLRDLVARSAGLANALESR